MENSITIPKNKYNVKHLVFDNGNTSSQTSKFPTIYIARQFARKCLREKVLISFTNNNNVRLCC